MMQASPFPAISKRLLWLLGALLLAACGVLPPGNPTPTPPQTEIVQAATPSPTPSLTLPPAVTPRPLLESPTPTETPGPPTATFTPTATEGPIEHTVQRGDTLFYILGLYGLDFNAADELLALNPQIPDPDRLPGVGTTILVPRPTPSPTPENFELTASAMPAAPETAQLPGEPIIMQVTIGAGQTIIGLTNQFETTLQNMARLNPQLVFTGCDFSNPSGGPDCSVIVPEGAPINVPAPTPTPTLSPTFSGNETPTPTPTYAPPMLIFPPQNASLSGTSRFQFQWVSVGILLENEWYVVLIEDTTAGTQYTGITKSTSYTIPPELIPTDGQPHTFRWTVGIGIPNEQNALRLISGEPRTRTFTWVGG